MKKLPLLIIACQLFCIFPLLSQTPTNAAPAKPATDACPTWNKKQGTSKADYFAYLSKRQKSTTKEVNNFYTPRYYNYNAASNSASQKQLIPEAKSPELRRSKVPAVVPEKENKTIQPGTESADKTKEETTPVINAPSEKLLSEKEKGDAVLSSKKADPDKKNNGTIHLKKLHLKKIRFRKKSATSCPEFN